MHKADSPSRRLQRAVEALQSGNPGRAVELALSLSNESDAAPVRQRALHVAGMAGLAAGQFQEALQWLQAAARMSNPGPDILESLAEANLRAGNHADALTVYAKAVALPGASLSVFLNLAQLQRRAGDLAAAERTLKRVCTTGQRDPRPWTQLGNLLVAGGRNHEAIEAYRRSHALDQTDSKVLYNLGQQLLAVGDAEGAKGVFETAIRLDPALAQAVEGLATAHEQLGDFDKAAEIWSRILQDHPTNPKALAGLLAIGGQHAGPDRVAAATAYVDDDSLKPLDRALVGHSLGKHLDRSARYEEAFHAFASANALVRGADRFDRGHHSAEVDGIISAFSADFLARWRAQAGAKASVQPIFIIGMPRSGTTLLEQILSRHPAVFAAGELETVGRIAARLDKAAAAAGGYPACMRHLQPEQLTPFAEAYRAQLRLRGWSGQSVPTDKMPINFHHLGLIRMLFPHSIVLHCRRNPIDTGLSCFFERFADHQIHSTDLGDIGFYYAEYHRLMQHWKACFDDILDVHYEDTVGALEQTVRGVLAHCGLDWSDQCMDFSSASRSVGTPSRWQVRQKLYTSSMERWRAYQPHVGPLLEALRPTGLLPPDA